MIHQSDLMRVVHKYRGDAIVIPENRASREWPMITANRQRDMPSEIMGKSASFALGVCLAQPDTKVIIFDGDGGLEMNLGTLATISGQQPSNLYHFVFENGMYATTGGQPIPGKDKISFTGLARAAGYIAAHDFEDLEDFADQVEGILDQPGPVLICVKIVPTPRPQDMRIDGATWDGRRSAQVMYDLREALGVE